MVSRLILNLRNQAMQPRAAVVSFASSQGPSDRLQLTSNVIGNLGEPVENSWFGSEKSGGEDNDDTYAMEILDGLTDLEKHNPGRNTAQIVVEVTRSITTDYRMGSHSSHQRPDSGILISRSSSPVSPTTSSRPRSMVHYSREEEEARERAWERGGSAWRPPPSWMLESMDLYQIATGRPRRSQRRPSTS